MRHGKAKLKMNMSQGRRKSVLKSLARRVFESKRVITTTERAKAVRPVVERIITRAKKGTLHDIRMIEKILNDRRLVATIVKEIAPHYVDRKGGYTRIIKYKRRPGDNAVLSIFELIGDYTLIRKVDEDKSKDKKKSKKKEKESIKEKKKKKPAKAKKEKKSSHKEAQ
ncbi:MAG: 50S ribosomal protein L17 [Candidatus Aureabacteria bacterium]|nr:50S ribosomal protein L17 [Candidatus Auribacterota bacterium]